MPKINFLPPDLVPKSLTVKAAKVINRVVIIGFALFICTALVFIALFFLNMSNLANLTQKKNQALAVVKNYQAAEQSLYLIRDRLGKIKTVQSLPTSIEAINAISPILDQLPGSLTMTDASFAPTISSLTFQTVDPTAVSQLMATVIGVKSFSTISLKSFSYNETAGYKIEFDLTI
jgi:hypothetical protein